MAGILDTIRQKQGDTQKSASWYRNAIGNLRSTPTARKLMNQGRLNSRPSAGRLNLFFYDPKTKNKLPYYDIFPLVLPLEPIKGGFLGMNFHYLPYLLRLQLLESLEGYSTDLATFGKNAKLAATYDRVSSSNLVKPTLKKYLYNQLRSQFLRIDVDEMAIAVMLPVQQFRKAGVNKVWRDSRSMI